jgi:hypothetical protein
METDNTAENEENLCPLCGSASYFKTDEQVDIEDTLKRWELALNIKISEELWSEYRNMQKNL